MMNELNNIINKITVKTLKGMTHGEEIIMGNFTLYHYLDSDIIVLVHTVTWQEIVQLLYICNKVEYEILNTKLFSAYNLEKIKHHETT